MKSSDGSAASDVASPRIDGISVVLTATLTPWQPPEGDGTLWRREWIYDRTYDHVDHGGSSLAATVNVDDDEDCFWWNAWGPFSSCDGGRAPSVAEAQLIADAWLAARCGATPPSEDPAMDRAQVGRGVAPGGGS